MPPACHVVTMVRIWSAQNWRWASLTLIVSGLIVFIVGTVQPPHWRGICASLGILITVVQSLFFVFDRYPFRDL